MDGGREVVGGESGEVPVEAGEDGVDVGHAVRRAQLLKDHAQRLRQARRNALKQEVVKILFL